MKELRLTVQQEQYLVSELKNVVDNYDAYGLESPEDYETVLSLLTEMFNEDWNTDMPKAIVNDYLTAYFEQELSA